MRVTLSELDSSDARRAEQPRTSDPERFVLAVGATIEPAGSDGGDLSRSNPATSSWLAKY
jgi:hypothetical protein